MTIECPKCQVKYRLAVAQFAGRPRLQVRCPKCENVFSVEAPTSSDSSAPPQEPVTEATVINKSSGTRLPEGKKVSLSVTQGPMKGTVFAVTKPRVVLGRAQADIVVEDAEVSRKHCALELHGTTALLVDLGSTNGTFFDGQRIETQELGHLSEFRLGGTTLMLTVTDKE